MYDDMTTPILPFPPCIGKKGMITYLLHYCELFWGIILRPIQNKTFKTGDSESPFAYASPVLLEVW